MLLIYMDGMLTDASYNNYSDIIKSRMRSRHFTQRCACWFILQAAGVSYMILVLTASITLYTMLLFNALPYLVLDQKEVLL